LVSGYRTPPDPNVVGVDGAQWIFEGAKDGTYHVVGPHFETVTGRPIGCSGLTGILIGKLIVGEIRREC